MPETLPPVPSGMPASSTQEPEIHVIPEKYYGAALRANVPETVSTGRAEAAPGAITPPKKTQPVLLFVLGGIILFLLAGGIFLYFNPSILFPVPAVPPAPVVTPTPVPTPPPQPPSAPTALTATSTNPQSVSLTWVDTAADESGFRLERAESSGVFQAITNLPTNSTSFIDASVQPGTTYRYRLIATNAGGDSGPSAEASVAVASLPPPPPEQPKLPPAGLDSDSDGLTDLEETLYGTNAHNPDTDGDGFLDGNEVFHLYNPNGRAPARLIDAKLVKLIESAVGWKMQVPTTWATTIAPNGSSATMTSGHGEVFKVSIEANAKQLSVLEWYLASHPDVKESQVLQFRSKKGYEGIIGADLLTTYIPWGDRIFVFTYDIDGQSFINYRTTYSMMLNSLELSGIPQTTPAPNEAPLPFEPGATTTGVVAQPTPVEVFPSPTSSAAVTATTTPEQTTSSEPVPSTPTSTP